MTWFLEAREALGHAIGRSWSPVTAAVSSLRHARTFHPEGIVCTGRADAVSPSPFPALSDRLRGPLLVRFSAALWKGRPRRFDVLGIAVRFDEVQDLLFATIRSPFTMPFAPILTTTDDFCANRYWAVSPFEVEGAGRLKFRLSPVDTRPPTTASDDRAVRLIQTVQDGGAVWQLEAREVFHRAYHPIATLTLDRVDTLRDQDELRFDPYRNGRGITPSGLVHALRPGAYDGSQRGRSAT